MPTGAFSKKALFCLTKCAKYEIISTRGIMEDIEKYTKGDDSDKILTADNKNLDSLAHNETKNETHNEPPVNSGETQNTTPEQTPSNKALEVDRDQIEKESFSPFAYRRLQRARRKALHYGVEIPKLKYKLTRPVKPRPLFAVVGYIMLVALIAVIAASAFIILGSGVMKLIASGPEFYEGNEMTDLFGITQLTNMGIFLFYILLLGILILPIGIIALMVSIVKRTFALANASYQEIGRGHILLNYIVAVMVAGVASLVMFFVLLNQGTIANLHWTVIMIWLVFTALLFLFGTALIIERVKARKMFNALPEEQKQDFIAMDEAWQKYKSRKEASNTSSRWRW